MSGEPAHTEKKPKVHLEHDPSGAEKRDVDETATAILKKKKKPNSLMYVISPSLKPSKQLF
jgi:transitional endoplasmic reticulum ATPase